MTLKPARQPLAFLARVHMITLKTLKRAMYGRV